MSVNAVKLPTTMSPSDVGEGKTEHIISVSLTLCL